MSDIKYKKFLFNSDKVSATISSANVGYVISYLRKCGLTDLRVSWSELDKIQIPRVEVGFTVTGDNFSDVMKIFKDLKLRNWKIYKFRVANGPREDNLNAEVKFFDLFKDLLKVNKDFEPQSVGVTLMPVEYRYVRSNKDLYLESRYLFHFTERSNLKSILSKGLIPSDRVATQIDHPKCTHLLAYLGIAIMRYTQSKGLTPIPPMTLRDPVMLKVGPFSKFDGYRFFVDPDCPRAALVTTEILKPDLIEHVDSEVSIAEYFIEYDYKLRNQPELVNKRLMFSGELGMYIDEY